MIQFAEFLLEGLEALMGSIPLEELTSRHNRCRNLLKMHSPSAGGLIVFSRLNIYYFTGTFSNGLFWLPLEGEPVLLCRRGFDRARIESPLKNIQSFYSYKDIEQILNDAGSPLTKTIAAEMGGLPWALANSFNKYVSGHEFLAGDKIISITRSRKTEWELKRLRSAGEKHAKCMTQLLPPLLKNGITEFEAARLLSDLFFKEGHHGILRMENYGEEVYLGHISIGDSGNYPSVFNGPVGLRGIHPAVPHMGSQEIVWRPGMPFTIDVGFNLEGYHTDKTQVYWLGDRKTVPSRVQAAHDFCIHLQSWIAEHLKPGVRPSEIWDYSARLADEAGWSDGFMACGGNKVGFVGHGIGLAIDEYPAITKGFDLPLEEGMVLAIEPKIGIPDIGMVGVENTFEVTADGGKCLTGQNFDILCIAGR